MNEQSPPVMPKPDQIAAVVLDGGRGSRMGGADKGLLQINGRPLLGHVINRLAPQCGLMAISANGDPARFAAFGLPVLPDALPGHPGPLAGVLAGLDWAAKNGNSAIVTVAADTPFFPANLVEALLTGAGPLGVAIAASMQKGVLQQHPTFALWPITLREALRQALLDGQFKVQRFADAFSPGVVPFPEAGGDPFFNINAPADLELAQRMATRTS